MNKRGESEGAFEIGKKQIFYLIASVLFIAAAVFYVYTYSTIESQLTYLPEKIKAEAISLRFTNIPECFAYVDPVTGRVYAGIIDLNKFNQKQMDNCYFTDPEKGFQEYNFRLWLKNKNLNVITNNYFKTDDFTLVKKVGVMEAGKVIPEDLYIYVQAKSFQHGAGKEYVQ
ncbi:MAG: hypothetical protein AABX04_00815 [Nanoarchaeota archaeon]